MNDQLNEKNDLRTEDLSKTEDDKKLDDELKKEIENHTKWKNYMSDELKKIENKIMLQVSNWWGHQYSGNAGTIITNEKELYVYQYYFLVPEKSDPEKEIYVKKIRDLNNNEFEEIIRFIEEEVLAKDFSDEMIFDAGYDVYVNYNGTKKTVINNIGYNDNIRLYNKAKQIVDNLLKK